MEIEKQTCIFGEGLMKRIFLILAILVFGNFALAGEVVILHTSDTHGRISPIEYKGRKNVAGISRRSTYINQMRATNKNVLLLDSGDVFQGSLYYRHDYGKLNAKLLRYLKYDAIALGNHEFDNYISDIGKYYSRLKAVKLSANYDMTDTPCQGLFTPYVIKQYGGKRVAFMGINLNPKGMIADKNIGTMGYTDAVKVALSLSEYLKTSGLADYVVMVSHIGYTSNEGEESDVVIAKQSRYIDLIIGGHSHTLLDPKDKDKCWIKNAEGRLIPVCQAGKYGKFMGKMVLNLDNGEIDYSLIPVDARYDAWASRYTALQQWLKPYDDEVYRVMHSRIATSARAMSNTELSYLDNFVCDAVNDIIVSRWGKVDFAMMNRGGIRQPLPAGDVAEGMITSMLPFDNKLVVLKIKGSDLIDAFKVMTYRGGDAVSRALDVKFKDHDIVWAKLNGKNINPNKYYTMVTVDYLANGGDYMEPLKRAEVLFTDDVPYGNLVLQYVKDLDKQGKKIDAEGRVRMHK